MSTVRLLLELKEARIGKRDPVWVSPDATVLDAINTMWANKMGSVLVLFGGQLVGILTERDCLGKLEREHRLAAWTRVEEIMTPVPIETVSPFTTLDEVVERFRGKDIRHLPVLDAEGIVIDVISERDLVYALQAYGWTLEDAARGAMIQRT